MIIRLLNEIAKGRQNRLPFLFVCIYSGNMVQGFWKKIKKPIFALAPMYGVTDIAFREMIARHGKPSVMFTEFVSCEGLMSEGKKKLLELLKYTEKERPIVAQVFGVNPETYYESAKFIRSLGFDGIDINMGCPDKAVIKMGVGSALIENKELAKKIIEATKQGAGKMPVSVKTRIGFNTIKTEEWISFLLSCDIPAITIHGRTKKEMSKVPAHWDEIGKAVKLAKAQKSKTLIIGNGDVASYADGMEKIKTYGVDGVMIGRSAIGNPWIFKNTKKEITLEKRIHGMMEHMRLFERLLRDRNFEETKKHCRAYIVGFHEAKFVRTKLMSAKSLEEMKRIGEEFLNSLKN